MLLSELFEHLIHGELSQLSITGNGTKVAQKDYAKLTSHINLALTALFTRFNFRQEEVIIQQYDDITSYYLRPQFAVNSGSSEPIKYLVDTPESPFIKSIIKVEQAFNEIGEEIGINAEDDENSIYTPSYDQVQITEPNSENSTSIIYRALHDKLIAGPTTDLETIEVNIPPFLVTPISLFIANNLINTINTINKDGTVVGNNYLTKYEAFCNRIEMEGLIAKDIYNKDVIESNGWV